jgi:tetratricopeptide (TPR) repeat protein
MGATPADAKSIFGQALALLSPAEQAAFLDKACGDDAQMRAEVEALLEAHREAGSFLKDRGAAPVATLDDPRREGPGTVIGAYKLVQEIGEGGMGTVWMAQQHEPVKRVVALKVIKPGMDSKQVLARFEAERQALALMDHPNIAKVLDAGSTAAGRPYFVMELVKGAPLTRYCDEHRLTPKQRLELFVPVCQAIQHAHQKGIIHRDIKPSNVLVALYDGKPVPKVIDFGIAKAAGQQLTERTLVTGFGAVVGTLEYMSPEQAELNQLDIDTRSDIYSLGVLLYELLTGTTPLDRKRLKEAAMLELLRIIREEEPPKPSTRLSTTEELPSVAANRGLEPKKLSGLVRGELDWIVMKALEKDRNRRYETANGLAMDVQRYLADEPVQACPPSAWYRFGKFVRRNRAALTTMVLVAAALLTTVIVLVISNISISREEKEKSEALDAKDAALGEANASRQQAEENLSLVLAALDEVYITEAEKRLAAYRSEPNNPELTQDPRQTQVDRNFLQKGMGFYEKLIQPGNAEPAARFQTGKAYRRVGILQRELKQHDKAADALAKAVSLLDKLAEECPTEPQYRWELAQAYRWQGNVWAYTKVQKPDQAEQAYRRAATLAEELAADDRTRSEYRLHAATYRVEFGMALRMVKRIEQAEEEYLKALKLWKELVQEAPAERWYRHELAYNLESLGWLWEGVNQPEKAEPFFRQALKYHEELVAEDPTVADNQERLARTQVHLAQVLTSMGRLPDGEKARGAALAVLEKQDPKTVADLHARAETYRGLHEYDKALDDYSKAIELEPMNPNTWNARGYCYNHLPVPQPDKAFADLTKAIKLDPKSSQAHSNLGTALAKQGKLDEAVAEYHKAIELDPNNTWPHSNLGYALTKQGKLDEAVAECHKAIELEPNNALAHTNLGYALTKQGKLDEAIAEHRRAIELDPKSAAPHNNLGIGLLGQGKRDEAVAEFRKAIELDPKDALAHSNLGIALMDRGKVKEAVVEHRKAIELDPRNAVSHSNLGIALRKQGKLDDAVAACRKAIELDPKNAKAHYNLGIVLDLQGKREEAVAEYREAIALNPTDPKPHINLGGELHAQGRLDEAITEYRKAIELGPSDELPHVNLAGALTAQGRLDEAVAEYREAIRLDPHSVAQLYIRQTEQKAVLMKRLPAVLVGKDHPKDAAEELAFAQLCQEHRKQYAAAVRFYDDAFAAAPNLAEDSKLPHRRQAACAAALAGCGQGKDADKLDEKERRRLRRQALDWLRADLEAQRLRLEKEPQQAGTFVIGEMAYLLAHPAFAGVRGPEALAQLPEAEQQPWQKLWNDVADMLKRAQEKAAPEKKADAK